MIMDGIKGKFKDQGSLYYIIKMCIYTHRSQKEISSRFCKKSDFIFFFFEGEKNLRVIMNYDG